MAGQTSLEQAFLSWTYTGLSRQEDEYVGSRRIGKDLSGIIQTKAIFVNVIVACSHQAEAIATIGLALFRSLRADHNLPTPLGI